MKNKYKQTATHNSSFPIAGLKRSDTRMYAAKQGELYLYGSLKASRIATYIPAEKAAEKCLNKS